VLFRSDFATATQIDHLPYTNAQDTSLATVGSDDMFCGGLGGSVWYRITSQADQDIYVDATASDFPVSVSAYTGARGSLTQIGCEAGVLKINAAAGQTYNLMLSPFFRGSGGNLALNIYAVPALKLQVQVNETGFFDPRSGLAVICGKMTTSRPCQVRLAGTVIQDHGHSHHAAGTFQVSTVCPQSIVWRAVIPRPQNRFVGGTARVELAGFAFDAAAGDSADANARASVTLHGSDIHVLVDSGPPNQAAPKPHLVDTPVKQ